MQKRGNVDSVNVLAKAINIFSQVSGLHVNPLKSNIFLAGEIKDRTEDILALVPFPQGKLPVRYLGLPLTSQRASKRDFAPLVNKVDEHIRKWNAKTLSAAGRLELIRFVIQGIEGFWFQAFPIHKSVLDRITSLCRTFLWGSKFCKVAWEDICMPKDEGLNQPCIWNQALLSKNLWNIASNKETLWVQWVHSVYLDGNDFWTWSLGKKDSHFFKKLIDIRDMLLLKCEDRWELENQLCDQGFLTKTSLHFIAMENRLCELCHKEEETGQHLFFSCETSTLIWNAFRSWLEITSALSTLDRALTWLRRLRNNHCSKRKMTRLAILSTAYHIWRLRNGVYFDNKTINTDAIVCKIKRANTGVPWVTGVIPMPSFSGAGNISNGLMLLVYSCWKLLENELGLVLHVEWNGPCLVSAPCVAGVLLFQIVFDRPRHEQCREGVSCRFSINLSALLQIFGTLDAPIPGESNSGVILLFCVKDFDKTKVNA
ncbi:unnamed protein product [Cuscuta campestris]|uniref:Reverse transcriptase zinc-binding domain-containing protein n=1 Tax=Cuscuta campestris TaxID=132261 RepID=A0A484M538_9ASTE|nr:unnamed protein product [Cuscuta campestris]